MGNHTIDKAKYVLLPKSTQTVILLAAGPCLGGQIINQVNSWLRENGVEWTVSRLKAIRTAALNIKSSSRPASRNSKPTHGLEVAKQVYQSNSIGYTRDNLFPRGPFRTVVQGYTTSKKPLTIRKFSLLLRIYTSLILPDVSEKQYRKAKQSINHLPTFTSDGIADARSKVTKGWYYLKSVLPSHLFDEQGSLRLPRPDLRRLHPFTSVHKSPDFPEAAWMSLRKVPYGKWAASAVSVCAWPKAFRSDPDALGTEWDPSEGLYPFDVWDFIREHAFCDAADDAVGEILFLQEPGAKGRIVAEPNGMVQWGFEPLHKALDNLLQFTHWSCIHDQNRGAEYLKEILGHREVAGSIDLSSATDNFPRELMFTLLREMGLNQWIDPLEWVCQQDWQVETTLHGREVWHYGTGLPMGLYCCFPLFSLTYICLCLGIYFDLKHEFAEKGKALTLDVADAFRDVGDDIIVKSLPMIVRLDRTLIAIGCPVQGDKSLVSQRFGEFCGFEAHVTNRTVTVFRPYKFGVSKHNEFVKSGVSLIHSLGKRVCKLGKYWEKKYHLFELTKLFRNADLSPAFRLSDREEVHQDFLDIPRLTNLLLQADLAMEGPRYSGSEPTLWRLEVLSEILLSEEEESGSERPILEWEEPEKPDFHPYGGNISSDPFISGKNDLFLELVEARVKPSPTIDFSGEDLTLDVDPPQDKSSD